MRVHLVAIAAEPEVEVQGQTPEPTENVLDEDRAFIAELWECLPEELFRELDLAPRHLATDPRPRRVDGDDDGFALGIR